MKIIKTVLIVLVVISAFILFILIDQEVFFPSDILKSKKQINSEKKARVEFVREIVNSSPMVLKESLSKIDANSTFKIEKIDSKNIMFAISNTVARVNIPAPNILNIPKHKNEEFYYVLNEVLNFSTHKSEIESNKKLKKIDWNGQLSISKLNYFHSMIFITFKRSLIDKAMKDIKYKKDFEKYIINQINHEHVHMLGERSEYLAVKYGQVLDVDTSSDFFEDISYETVLEHIDNYFNFNSLSDKIDRFKIDARTSAKNKLVVEDILKTIQNNKDEIIVLGNVKLQEQYSGNKRYRWAETHNRSFGGAYFTVLTNGARFLQSNKHPLESIYQKSISAGLFFNINHLLKEEGFSKGDIKLFNSLIAESVLNLIYGKVKSNKLKEVQEDATSSLNLLTDICFKSTASSRKDLIN